MEKNIAELLLKNLLSRIVVDSDTGQGELPGVLTSMEVEALHIASGLFTSEGELAPQDEPLTEPTSEQEVEPESEKEPAPRQIPVGPPKAEATVEAEPKQEPDVKPAEKVASPPKPKPKANVKLNLTSLKFDTPQNEEIKMCLDFGTAMSKAFASMVEDDELYDTLLLKLGHRASGGTSKIIYPVPSSMWITNDGTIFLGEKAIALSLQSDSSSKRERFDSLKKELILGLKESSPFQQAMRESLNPTDVPLSMGDAIILYLGFLTDLACTELEESHGCSRYVLRNFGLPSWAPERREWGEKLLKDMLVKAQIVADTFHGKWQDGLDIQDVKSVLNQLAKMSSLPTYLVGQGITEPLAVASARLQEDEPFRGLAMVVDIGAGTSDLALFVVVKNPSRNQFNGFPVLGCNQSLHQAGDTLDTAIQQIVLQKSGVGNHDPDRPYIIQHLRMQVRTLKEDLFRDGACNVSLINGNRVTVTREEFLEHATVKRFKDSLAEKFAAVLEPMKEGVVKQYGGDGLSVVLSGGGATLPMVAELAEGAISVHGITVKKEKMDLVPEEFDDDPELAVVYPQLAVAIGGTMPDIIDEKKGIDNMDIPKGGFVLNNNPITGS